MQCGDLSADPETLQPGNDRMYARYDSSIPLDGVSRSLKPRIIAILLTMANISAHYDVKH